MNIRIILVFSIAILIYACNMTSPKDLLKESIIPKPDFIEATNSAFTLSNGCGIYYDVTNETILFVTTLNGAIDISSWNGLPA